MIGFFYELPLYWFQSSLFLHVVSYGTLVVNDQIALKQPGVRREMSLYPTLHAFCLTRKIIHLLLF